MNFLIVCGGSAGHINPAVAIAEEIRSKIPDSKILFTGADKELEKRLIPDAGFDLINIKMSGLRRGFSPRDLRHNIKTGINLIKADRKAYRLMKQFEPDAVIGTGGYICYPLMKKASKLKIPTFLLEPNAMPGLAVRMLDSITDKIFITYSGTEKNYKYPDRVIYTGTPLRKAFTEALTETSEKKEKPLVISYWGSLGAPGMNEKIVDFIKLNINQKKFHHIHAAGAGRSADEIITGLNNDGITEIPSPYADIREYITDMPVLMSKADLVICRSGASTIAELAALSKPAILIPSPNVTENHQEENAKQAEKAGGAIMITEKECTGEKLFYEAVSVIENTEKLEMMQKAQSKLATADASEKIVEAIKEFLNKK